MLTDYPITKEFADQLSAELINEESDIKSQEIIVPEVHDIKDYLHLKGKSGIFFLWYDRRIVYIACAKDLYQGIYARVGYGGTNQAHFLLKYVTGYSIIYLNNYDTGAAKMLRDALINSQRPVINVILKEYAWFDKLIYRDFRSKIEINNKEKQELEKLRVENEELKATLDNLINIAKKIRGEK